MNLFLYLVIILSQVVKPDTVWYGTYLMGNKIGYVSLISSRENSNYIFDETNVLQVKMLGVSKQVFLSTSLKTDATFQILSGKFTMITQDQRISGTLSRSKNYLTLKFQTERGTPISKEIELTKPLFVETTLRKYLEKNKVKRLEIQLLDIPTATVTEAICELISDKGGEQIYKLSYQGTESLLKIKNGILLSQEGPMGLRMVKEDKKEAMKFASSVDITEFYAVKTNVAIRASKYLRLKVVGALSGLELGNGPQKVLEQSSNYVRLEILKPDLTCSKSSTPVNVKKYLEPDQYIQSDHPEVVKLAQSITRGIQDPCKKVQAIIRWLTDNIEKVPSVTIPTALEVLRDKKGDCNEHAVLFAALARASGIPTDVVVGLIYQDGAYYYHAWNMVYIGDKWYFVDPIFGEFPASLYHLALATGSIEKQTDIMQVVGNLQVFVEEQK